MQNPSIPVARSACLAGLACLPAWAVGVRVVVLRLACVVLAGACANSAAAALAAPTASAAALQAACDGSAHFSVLRPAAPQLPARALWLDRRSLQWPGVLPDLKSGVSSRVKPGVSSRVKPDDTAPASPGPRFRLYGARRGGLRATPGQAVVGADVVLPLQPAGTAQASAVAARFRHLAPGVRLQLAPVDASPARLQALHRGELLLVQEDAGGLVQQASQVQHPGALDDVYAGAQTATLGVQVSPARPGRAGATAFAVWAPTAQQAWLCRYRSDSSPATAVLPLQRNSRTGVWRRHLAGDQSGQFYSYLVDVWVPGHGLLRQRVTDPYAISLGTDAQRAWIGSLDAPITQPPGWAAAGRRSTRPAAPAAATDAVVYELHVRDFSISDASVPPAQRGKYAAFSASGSAGMQHLATLARAGLTDVHLLPVFDIASVPERACSSPPPATLQDAAPDSLAQQAAVVAGAATDCFNWGYDPLHFNAPEGSYASRPDDGASRIRELRQLVLALHSLGLRVGMDVVYNHMSASGQHPQSVLDRLVPGYYHRLDANGAVERSTCCDNTATEHLMMGKLMRDSVRLWARQYRIDGFRFDLMGHQPRAAMLALQQQLQQDSRRNILLIGEGWNFGEVANGARFVQASQLSLGGSGIGTFNDRLRDALRGGGAGDGADTIVQRQGYLNGLGLDANEAVQALQASPAAGAPPAGVAQPTSTLLATADLVRLGLAGSLGSYRFTSHTGQVRSGAQLAYGDQPAGYASQPAEVVNYVENHDNHTLWDLNAFKLPLATSAADRARVQVLGLAFVAFSQGLPYFHAGGELLRSKSMDGNSFDAGDWFNRIDWTAQRNHFASGLPPAEGNRAFYPLIATRLADPRLQPAAADIQFARDAFFDLLRIRASSALFRLRSADAVQQRLQLHNTGPAQNPALIAAELDGVGLAGAGFRRLMLLFNVDKIPHQLGLPQATGQAWVLHPVHRVAGAADRRAALEAAFDSATGQFLVPARTAVVFVQP